jgi:hypothetical protein
MKILILTLITLILTSCGANKSVHRAKSNVSTSEQKITNEKTLKLDSYARSITLTDSIESLYKIVIYPLDTFQFSTKQGFKGKASKIELTALTKQHSRTTDTATLTTLTDHQKQLNTAKKSTNESSNLAKTVNRSKSYWGLNLGLVLALSIGILWVIKKATKYT